MKKFNVGDEVEILLHSRCRGYLDTGGGWSSDWLKGKIVKVNPVNYIVYTNEYYFSNLHSVPEKRIRMVK